MRIAILDIGSNTVRLLVADAHADGMERLCTRKARLRLGAEIERTGSVSELNLAALRKAVRKLADAGWESGAESLEVVVTAPGRQAANADDLLAVAERAARVPVRVVSAEEEAVLSFEGAVAAARPHSAHVAVCDLGGASTELAVGRTGESPTWVRSVDLGALRLTERVQLEEKPAIETVEHARREVARAFDGLAPPLAPEAFAVGGSARALRRIVGDVLGPDELAAAQELLCTRAHRTIERRYGIHRSRVTLLLASALILIEVQRRLTVPLGVVDGGLREGAVLEALRAAA